MNCKLSRGDVLSMFTQGGGGYGPPAERDRSAIERDIRQEKVSPEEARKHYGYGGMAE